MPVTTTFAMLSRAREQGYAVGAFNIENMEMAQAVIAAAEELGAPVILQTTPGTVRYASTNLYFATMHAAAAASSVPVAIHLDHGNSFALAVQALHAGYTSIMFDGSQLPLADNIAATKRVVDVCQAVNIPVEGELGHVGGKEDDTVSDGSLYTDPDEAVQFVAETGVSSLAVGVGTAHGVYHSQPQIQLALVSQLRKTLPIPLVLHGASGLGDCVVRESVARGISKVNFATELRVAYTQAVRESLLADPATIDPKVYGKSARQAVMELVKERIGWCGSQGKA